MNQAVVLHSKRLQMEPLKTADVEKIFQLHSFPEVAQFNTIGIPGNPAVTQSILDGRLDSNNPSELGWVLYDQQHNFLGEAAMIFAPKRFQKAEVSYSIHPDYWNQGYATEAVKRLIQFGFKDCQLHRLEAGVAVTNQASIRVLEKVGMQKEGRHRKILPLASGWTDNFSYSILNSEHSH